MIYKKMTKKDAVQDICDAVYPVLQISKKELKRIAFILVDEMFETKDTLTSDEYLEARGKLCDNVDGNRSDMEACVRLMAANTIPELEFNYDDFLKLTFNYK